jgi:hypothetical protein
MNTTYNGYANYATWTVALWIDNEQGSQEYWSDAAREALESAMFDKDLAVSNLAELLEDSHESDKPELLGVFADLLNAALGSVDWREIARNMIDEIAVYSAGFNMPGYMPDSEPAMFLDADEAREYIADEIERSIENEEDEEVITAHEEAAQRVRDGSGEFGETIGNYHYFVSLI